MTYTCKSENRLAPYISMGITDAMEVGHAIAHDDIPRAHRAQRHTYVQHHAVRKSVHMWIPRFRLQAMANWTYILHVCSL